jgi:putative transposase
VIRLVVLMYVRFPLSLRNVEDLLFERGIDICHETVRHWWNRFGPMVAGDIRRQRVSRMRGFRHRRWHLDEMYVKLNGEMSTCGVRSTMKVRCSKATSPGPATRRQRFPS